MRQKIADTSQTISNGGRLKEYWDQRGIRQRRSSGMDWDGNEIDLREILERYKLKGFDFGRYVNNEDRYDFVIGAKESLKDLSWLLKTDNIGIERKVGVAFGARGRGGRVAAHYEPAANMINLTKRRGASALAHEYGHALDYTIGTFIDQNRHYRALSGGRSMAAFPDDNTGDTCRLLMRRLISEIKATDSFARLKEASDYWHYNTEVFARYFEQWCCYTLRMAKKSNGFLTSSWTGYTQSPAYLTEADFKKTLPIGNKLMKNIGLLLSGKATEKYEDPGNEKKEPIMKPIPNPRPKKAAATTGKKTKKAVAPRTASRSKASETNMKLVYQKYEKAFTVLSKFTLNSPVNPSLATVYHEHGDMVATDAHILAVIHEAKYPKQKEGKAVFARKWESGDKAHPSTRKPGEVYEGKYPNYKAVFPQKLDLTTNIDLESELEKARKHVEYEKRVKAESKEARDYYAFLEEKGMNSGGIIPYKFRNSHFNAALLVKALRFLKGAGLEKAVLCQYSDKKAWNRASVLIGNNLEVLIMPVMKEY